MLRFIPIALALLLLAACGRQEIEQQRQMIDSLSADNQALRTLSLERDSMINEFFAMLNEIESNLALIKQREQLIARDALRSDEMQADVRERITNDIQLINELMVRNRQTIRHLNQRLRESNLRIEELTKRIALADQLLAERDSVILGLKSRLTQLDFTVETLNATVDSLTLQGEQLRGELGRKTELVNTRWFAFGSRQELLANGIIVRTGGVLGLGRTSRLSDNPNESYFTSIDITQTHSIPLFVREARLITSHPTDSYALITNAEKVVERIDILDPERFWSASRYLVVQVE